MSDYLDDAEKMRDKLKTVSGSFCLAKWQQTSLHLTTGNTNSCYHPSPHKIDKDEIKTNPSALHNTKEKKMRRREMLLGEKPEECSYCWQIEETGSLSDRHYRSGEPWAAEHFERIATQPYDTNEIPSYVEVNFNNTCNLMCSYCSPQYSSAWAAHAEQFGAYPTSNKHNDPQYFVGSKKPLLQREANPYVEAFWKWWPDLYPKLKHFRMTGGEPLMDRNTYKVFDYILANPKKDLHVDVTSNFCVDGKLFDKYMKAVAKLCEGEQIEHFMQYVSVDTYGPQAEYLRAGLDFEKLQRNVERFLTEIPGRNSVTFIITMNALSIVNVEKLLWWILELREKHSKTYQRVWFDTPILKSPNWQAMNVLPVSYDWYLGEVVKRMGHNPAVNDGVLGFKDYEIQKMQRNVDWMSRKPPAKYLQEHRADFYKFFNEYDKRHGYKFVEVFPEMQDFWEECNYAQRIS